MFRHLGLENFGRRVVSGFSVVDGAQTFLGKGSNDTPGARMDVSEQMGNRIVKVGVAGAEDLGKDGAQTFLGAGSSATPGAQMNTSEHLGSNIVKTQVMPSPNYTGGLLDEVVE